MPIVKLIELQPGDILKKDVVDYAGRLLVSKGTVLNSDHIYKLSRRNVSLLEIEDRKSEPSLVLDPIVAPEAPATTIKHEEDEGSLEMTSSLRRRIPKIRGEQATVFSPTALSPVNPSVKSTLKANHPEILLDRAQIPQLVNDELATNAALFYDTLCLQLPESNWKFDYSKIQEVVSELLNDLFPRKNTMVKLRFNTAHPRRYNSFHAINSCLLGSLISNKMGLPRNKVETIARALFLHDIGKATIPDEKVRSSVSLTETEMLMAKKHPQAGYLILKANPKIEEEALLLVRDHHERYDGSGYPQGLTSEDISIYGRLAAVIDVFDAMTSDRPYRRKVPLRMALQELLNHINVDFDPGISRLFVSTIGYFPIGSIVELSDKSLGVVTEQVENSLMRPVVRVLYDANSDSAIDETINLTGYLKLSIVNTLA